MRRFVNEFEDPDVIGNDAQLQHLMGLISDCNRQLEALGAFDHENEDLGCGVARVSGSD